ncbi:MAG: GDSL-type esterase/lipase family protein [Cyclobacteriaceae bacterium]
MKLKLIKVYIGFALCYLMSIADSSAQVINAGVGGNTTIDLLERIDTDVLREKPDLVILMVGTNDMLNSKKMITYDEYRQNLERIMVALKQNGLAVLMMSSPPVDSAYLFQRHDRNLFTEAPNEKISTIGKIAEALASQHDAYFLDLYSCFVELGLPKYNHDLFIKNPKNSGKADGVHPTALGYHFIATNIFEFLKGKQLLDTYKKIVCFGDSITYGGGSDQSYPEFLAKQLITLQNTKGPK